MRLGLTEILMIIVSLAATVVPVVVGGYILLLIIRWLRLRVEREKREQAATGEHPQHAPGSPTGDGLTLAERLRQLRSAAGYSQELLADRLGVSRQAVSKWETGTAEPSTANLLALADLYGITVDALLRGKTEG